jgi:hypothetical protein
MTAEIKSNLENLFNNNIELLKNSSVEETLNEFKSEIEESENPEKKPELISLFNKAKKMEFEEEEIITEFKTDILNSVPKLLQRIDSENNGFKNQIIFLEYDSEPCAYFCGFGKGSYPILTKPEYFSYNYMEESFNGIGKVDYSKIWNNLTKLNKVLDELDIFDEIWETTLYQSLLNSIKYKTYLLLHEAFDQIGIKAFNGIEIEKPLMIYGNEHDCESINIYAFE